MEEIKAECSSCGGTGLYSGFAEPKGTAVVCLTCSGTGCMTIRYKPFTKRREKRGIKTVQRSRMMNSEKARCLQNKGIV